MTDEAFDLDAPPKCAVCDGDVSAMHFDGPCNAWLEIDGIRVWLCSLDCAFALGKVLHATTTGSAAKGST